MKLPTTPKEEEQVIGSLLLDPKLLPEISSRLQARDFSDPCHRQAYEVLVGMWQDHVPIEILSVKGQLDASPAFTAVEGNTNVYLATTGGAVATAAHCEYYAGLVAEASCKRRLHQIASEASQKALGVAPPSEVIADMNTAILELQQEPSGTQRSSSQVLDELMQKIRIREKTQYIHIAPSHSELASFPIAKGHVVLIGAPPAEGKTALVMQAVFDALRLEGQEELRALVANVEMSFEALLTRQLARVSGVGHSFLMHRDCDQEAMPNVEAGASELRRLMGRVEFMKSPFTLDRLSNQAETSKADIVVVDYAQRFKSADPSQDLRVQTNEVMDCCRRIADEGRAVIVVSAMSRQRNAGGATYDSSSMGLASFRESSELEYGADSAWVLARDGDTSVLRCVKNRHGSLPEITMIFDGSRQIFKDDPRRHEWNP